MSTTMRLTLAASCLAALLSAGPIVADDERVVEEEVRTTTTTTTSEGTISQVSPNRIVIRTTQSADPLTYTQTKTTTYVDEMGNPVAIETVRTGMPVKVFYDKGAGGEMRATRVVVQKRTIIEEDD